MTNPNDELLQSIKTLLEQHQAETDRKITTAQTNIERKITTGNMLRDSMTQTGIKREIQATEDNLQKKMEEQTGIVLELIKSLHTETIQAIGDLADTAATQKEVDEHTKRIEKLEHLQKTS